VKSWTHVAATLRRHPSSWLLAAQLLAVLLHPFFELSGPGRALFLLAGNVVLALTLVVIFRNPTVNWIGWLLALPAVAFSLAGHFAGLPELLPIGYVLEALLYFYAAGGLIHYMLEDHEISPDELVAAAATFTLLAWAFAFAFSATQALAPGSFNAGASPEEPRTWLELLYLSFAALSGVGLSDIVPVGGFARSLLMIEMFAGVMYMALIVSRLVALATMKAMPKR
jgi:hypothetical protein